MSKERTKIKTPVFKTGDKFTLAGFCVGAKGQLVIDGRSVKTGRKCKAIKPQLWIAEGEA
jgi:hypothetical protein